MKKKLISYGVHVAIVILAVVLVYDNLAPRLDLAAERIDPIYEVYRSIPQAWYVRCWADALFIIGVLMTGVGALMWIASTGFFDLLRYAGYSIWMIFNPMKSVDDTEKFDVYKRQRAEAREGKPVNLTALIVGAVTLLLSFVLSMVTMNMIGG